MIHRSTALPGHRRGLFARAALALTSALLLVGAAVLGAFVFVALLGLFVLAATALWARVAWLRWRLRRGGKVPGAAVPPGIRQRPGSTTVDGDYVVLTPGSCRQR